MIEVQCRWRAAHLGSAVARYSGVKRCPISVGRQVKFPEHAVPRTFRSEAGTLLKWEEARKASYH